MRHFFFKYMLLNVYQNKTFYRVWTPVSAYFHRNLLTLINWFFFERHNVFNTVHEKKQHSHESIHFKFWFLYLVSSVLLLLRYFLSNSIHIPVFHCLICKYLIVVDNPKIKSRDLFGFICVYIFSEWNNWDTLSLWRNWLQLFNYIHP